MSDDPFFNLQGAVSEVTSQEALIEHLAANDTLSNALYRPDLLKTAFHGKLRLRDRKFVNVSFSKTRIEGLEFQNCEFHNCLFIGTLFYNCRFSECRFISTNMYRVEFEGTFVDPRSFKKCLDWRKYANIGVHLYQELLRNSRVQAQPDFADEAHFQFRRWQRLLNQSELKDGGLGWLRAGAKCCQIFWGIVFEYVLGSGVRLRNLLISAAALIAALSWIHWNYRVELGLLIRNPADAFYFTSVALTTLGFGDITPTTECGRWLVGGEALVGFLLLATLASTVFRKFSS